MKAQYGASSCHLLRINSVNGSSGSPGEDLWADLLGPREEGEVRVEHNALLISSLNRVVSPQHVYG